MIFTHIDLARAPCQQIFRRDELLAIRQLSERELQLDVANQISSRGPDSARRTVRHYGIIECDIGDRRLSVDIIAVRTGMIAFQRLRHIERRRFHPQRIEDRFLHGSVVRSPEFHIGIHNMRANVPGGRCH